MPKRKVSKEVAQLFALISKGLKGCWIDEIHIDRVCIESNTCPSCWQPLKYRGFSNAVEYRAFGICERCDFAKQFWSEGAELVIAKKQICKGAKRRKAEKVF
jgi:hypothetical protein